MYIQHTSTEALSVIFGVLGILCIICACAYFSNFKKRRRQVTMSPQRLPKAWYGVREQFIIPNQHPQEFV